MHKRRKVFGLIAAMGLLLCTGCSRSVLNYQVAECIGTLDKYENNEPVETPKMKAEREQKESAEALESEQNVILEQAEGLAKEYRYEEAISLLQSAEILEANESAADLTAKYTEALDAMYEYEGDIGHLSFTNLIVDPETAFSSEYGQGYRDIMITIDEFRAILDELYKGGYILIDIHELADESGTENDVTMTSRNPVIPQGKKPFVLSINNLNYDGCRNGGGVPTRLTLDENGEVAAVYMDQEGHELTGAYDVIPVLEQFIEEHPDFSFRGARGIISLSGYAGIFGYQFEEGSALEYEKNKETVTEIAEKLLEDGWAFASSGYSYQYMRDMSYDALKEDFSKWESTVGEIVGSCDTLLYPDGVEVDYTTEKGAFVVNRGFHYLLGLWAEGDYREVKSTYLRQTRRSVTGYILENYPNNFDAFFLTSSVKDSARK